MSHTRSSCFRLLLFAMAAGCSPDLPVSPQDPASSRIASADGIRPSFSSSPDDPCLYNLMTNCSNGMTAATLMDPAEFHHLGGFDAAVHDGITGGSGMGTWDLTIEAGAPPSSCVGSYPGCTGVAPQSTTGPEIEATTASTANCRPNTYCVVTRVGQIQASRYCPTSYAFNWNGPLGTELWSFTRTGTYSAFGQSMARYEGQYGVSGGGSHSAVSYVHCNSGSMFANASFYYYGAGGGPGGTDNPY
jgi:hypothetical protein